LAAILPRESGRRVCTLCGERERRVYFAGVLVSRESLGGMDTAWFTERLPAQHEHDWARAGCSLSESFFGGAYIGCTLFYEDRSLLAMLPRYRDQDLAQRALARMASMTAEKRYDVLRASQALSDVPQLFRDEPTPPSEAALAAGRERYADWRLAEPALADLYPAELP
jgi:hypothetical protein